MVVNGFTALHCTALRSIFFLVASLHCASTTFSTYVLYQPFLQRLARGQDVSSGAIDVYPTLYNRVGTLDSTYLSI